MSTDIHIFNTTFGGEVTKDLATRDGLESAVYLSLFGGNRDDDGREGNAATWWGNIGAQTRARKYVSEAANLTESLPPTSSNLRRIEDAAKRDVDWLKTGGYCKTITVSASIPALKTLKLVVALDGFDPMEFTFGWGEVTYDDLIRYVPPPIVRVNGPFTLSGDAVPGARVYLVDRRGVITWARSRRSGEWEFSPYPLRGAGGTLFATLGEGLISKGGPVQNFNALLYDGSTRYDGSEQYDGVKDDL